MFSIALLFGIFLPGLADDLKDLVIPALAVVMTLSLMGLKFSKIRPSVIMPYLLLNYLWWPVNQVFFADNLKNPVNLFGS